MPSQKPLSLFSKQSQANDNTPLSNPPSNPRAKKLMNDFMSNTRSLETSLVHQAVSMQGASSFDVKPSDSPQPQEAFTTTRLGFRFLGFEGLESI